MVILTEQLILENVVKEYDAEVLDLSDRGITAVDLNAFEKFTKLHTIDLSKNQLTELPRDLKFPTKVWWRVDLRDNLFPDYISLAALHLSEIQELLISGNKILVEDEHKLQYLIQSLRRLDDKPCDTSRLGDNLTIELQDKIEKLWNKEKKALYKKHDGNIDKICSAFRKKAFEIRTAVNSLKLFVKWRLTSDLVPSFLFKYIHDAKENDGKLLQAECSPKEATKRPRKQKASPQSKSETRNTSKSDSDSDDPVDPDNESKLTKRIKLLKHESVKTAHSIENREKYLRSRWSEFFRPLSFIRHHSDINDNSTNIWAAKFEPQYNEVLASAAGNKVVFNQIHSEKPVKVFQVPEEKEFFSLTWFVQNNTSYAAIGGYTGNLYFVDVKTSKSFGKINKLHNATINEIYFTNRPETPNNQTVMITCGLDNNKRAGHEKYLVTISDLTIEPENKRYSHQVICSFSTSPAGNPLRLLRVNNSLFVGCENTPGILVFDEQFVSAMKRNAPIKTTKNCDYILNWEDTNKRMTIDGMCTIQDEHGLVAVKISASTKLHSMVNESDYVHAGMILIIQFYEWNQESVILRRLDYSNTNEIYMSISYIPTLQAIIAGDELGNIWIYEVSDVIDGKVEKELDFIFPVSAIIPFPNRVCHDNDSVVDDKVRKQINMITNTNDGKMIVAASSCNLLCVYKPHPKILLANPSNTTIHSDTISSDSSVMEVDP